MFMGAMLCLLPVNFSATKTGLLMTIIYAGVIYTLSLLVLKAIGKEDLKLILPKNNKPSATVLENKEIL